MSTFSSSTYWENRYLAGGNSGAGSFGRLACFKAAFINAFVRLNNISSVVDFGCGDGTQLGLMSLPKYTGIDSSQKALDMCRAKFLGQDYQFVGYDELADAEMAELAISMDIIYHLVEDQVFEKYMRNVFAFATDYVILYTSNYDYEWAAEHVRHRWVSKHVQQMFPDWSLLAHVPNIYPFDAENMQTTSFSDFFVYGLRRGCDISIPNAVENTDCFLSDIGSGATSRSQTGQVEIE
jgi:SAM-dependent methyltransferase